MADRDRDTVNCEDMQAALRQSRALTAAESAHVEHCESCLEAWLNVTVTQALDAKPAVKIPADFVARVASQLPEKPVAQIDGSASTGQRQRHWGLVTAIVLVTSGIIGTTIADPTGLTSRMGAIFLLIVASEIAGIALWLGIGRSGGSSSR